MRKYLPVAGVLIAALAVAASGLRSVQSAATSTPTEISVTAEGVGHAPPDTARLWIGVEVFGSTLGPADREADQRIAAVIATLHSAGVADPHIRTIGITVAPQYVTQNGQPQELSGYISRSMLEVETADLRALPALIDAAMASGANRVDQIRCRPNMTGCQIAHARHCARRWWTTRQGGTQNHPDGSGERPPRA